MFHVPLSLFLCLCIPYNTSSYISLLNVLHVSRAPRPTVHGSFLLARSKPSVLHAICVPCPLCLRPSVIHALCSSCTCLPSLPHAPLCPMVSHVPYHSVPHDPLCPMFFRVPYSRVSHVPLCHMTPHTSYYPMYRFLLCS